MPPPEAVVHSAFGKQLGHKLEGPREIAPVEQLILTDEDGDDHFVRLYPDMTERSIQREIDRACPRGVSTARLSCADENAEHYVDLLKSRWPRVRYQEQETVEPGVHTVDGEYVFRVDDHYFRAIAKIAFHYYLAHSGRARGDEDGFADIRYFIMNGGPVEPFFAQSPRRTFAVGSLLRGCVPHVWCHCLAVDETCDPIQAYVHLFMGPEFQGIIHHVRLGCLKSCLVLPVQTWGHVYRYDAAPEDGGTVGTVERLNITSVRLQ